MYSVKIMLKRILKYAKPYRRNIIIALIFAILFECAFLYVPCIMGNEIIALFGEGFEMSQLTIPLVKAFSITAAGTVFGILMGRLLNVSTYLIIRDIRLATFKKILSLPVSYLDAHYHGDLLTRVTHDVDQVYDGLIHGFTHIFRGVVAVILTMIFMFMTKWDIALVVVVLTPLSAVIAYFVTKLSKKSFAVQAAVNGEMAGLVNEMVTEQKTVIAYSLMKENTERFNEIDDRLKTAGVRAQFVSSLARPTTRFANAIIYACVATYGLIVVIRDAKSVEEYPALIGMASTFLFYASQYTRPFNEIAEVTTELANSFASLRRIFELIDAEDMVKEDTLKEIEVNKGEYEINHVNFAYQPERMILKDISFKALQNKRVALVGPTGCGKTTLINLLMRYYDVSSGEIKLEGENINHIKPSSLRKSVGMVLQDTWLFKGTVLDNIRYAKDGSSDDEVMTAAIAANAHDFIMKLPQGYQTIIDDDEGLSTGQKQLICIARLMLVLPKILILDEATSNIDTRTEVNIQKAFNLLMDNRTSIVIAHRLSTIRHADLIIVMKDGRIIERGNHDELIKAHGYYYELYNAH
ncbi:MAG: ABC transporter ATP-binding protein/permease [Bacilli bacterium]|nr:ABC transporter ATP-binding protein/permease [Bacilli bacterium]